MGNGAKDAPVGGRSCSDSCQAASRAKWPAGSRRRRGAGHPPASSLQHEPVYPSGKVRAAPVGSLSINTFRDMASWLVAARTRISLRACLQSRGFCILIYRDIRHLAAAHHTRAFACSSFQLSKDALSQSRVFTSGGFSCCLILILHICRQISSALCPAARDGIA